MFAGNGENNDIAFCKTLDTEQQRIKRQTVSGSCGRSCIDIFGGKHGNTKNRASVSGASEGELADT